MKLTTPEKAGCAPAHTTFPVVQNPSQKPDAPSAAATAAGGAPRKILILDDDPDFLDVYRKLLSQLPSRPEVHTANSAARAFALLESESFALMITDLRMPKMDGFQVLTGVCQKFPSLRTIVLTSLVDEQYRARAYAMGIDLYTEKPGTPGEIKLFIQCVEALLNRGAHGGFRGVQSKSLMDLVQLECLSQNSSVLRITNGSLEAKIWIHGGEVVDAQLKDLGGEEAFKSIFAWRSGNFEMLPGEPARKRTIFASHQGLLLDTAQMMDESCAPAEEGANDADPAPRPCPALAPLARVSGVESLLLVNAENAHEFEAWGVENAERFAEWTQRLTREWRALGERLNAGTFEGMEALGSRRHLALVSRNGRELLAGFDRTLSPKQVREAVKELSARWEP